MAEYALLINNEFKEIRHYEERPEDIPHKGVEWLPVSRKFGEMFSGVDGGVYLIQTVDPSTIPPKSVSAASARRALLAVDELDRVENAISLSDKETQIMWEYEIRLQRDHPKIISLGESLNLDLDSLFLAAGKLDVTG